VPTFCRHNRFFADCPICSKGTVLDPDRASARRPRAKSPSRSGRGSSGPVAGAPRASRGPFASVGPYDGAEIRLERVPGGLRMAAWRGGQLDRTAPVVDAADVPALLADAASKELLAADGLLGGGRDEPAEDRPEAAQPGVFGVSPGRAGELRDELRVERLDGARVRVARWVMRPNRGWELQEAPVMLPPGRFVQALAAAADRGVLAPGGHLASGGPVQ
jgi:hypothetical protein